MCKTDSLAPSFSFTSSFSLEGRDQGRGGSGGQGWNGHHGWDKAQRRDEGWGGGSVTIWQAKHTSPGVMCFPHLLIFERPLIILDTLSAHSLRIISWIGYILKSLIPNFQGTGMEWGRIFGSQYSPIVSDPGFTGNPWISVCQFSN